MELMLYYIKGSFLILFIKRILKIFLKEKVNCKFVFWILCLYKVLDEIIYL